MAKVIQGGLSGKGKKFAVVISRFNEFVGSKLLAGCTDVLTRMDVAESDVDVAWVPGAFEIPLVAKKLAESKKYNAVICLGAVIRGQTAHFEHVAAESAKGIANASMTTGIPVIYGVLTTDTIEQAIERAGSKAGNRGANAAQDAIEMANLMESL